MYLKNFNVNLLHLASVLFSLRYTVNKKDKNLLILFKKFEKKLELN